MDLKINELGLTAYDVNLIVPVVSALNAPYGLQLSQVSRSSHLHSGDLLMAVGMTSTGQLNFTHNKGVLRLGHTAQLACLNSSLSATYFVVGDDGAIFGLGIPYLQNYIRTNFTLLANGYELNPCSVEEKEDIAPIQNPISEIKKLIGATFRRKGSDKKEAGFVAENLELSGLPGAVSKKDGKFQSINPIGTILPLLVECVKAILVRLEALEGR